MGRSVYCRHLLLELHEKEALDDTVRLHRANPSVIGWHLKRLVDEGMIHYSWRDLVFSTVDVEPSAYLIERMEILIPLQPC